MLRIYKLSIHIDPILNISLQPSGFGQSVGERQDVICSIYVPPDVNPDTIEFGWINEDDIITNDSRVTIVRSSNDSFNGSTLVTTIRFDSLFEEDDDQYICYAIINGSFIYEFTDPLRLESK